MKSPSGLLTTKHLAGTAPLPNCSLCLRFPKPSSWPFSEMGLWCVLPATSAHLGSLPSIFSLPPIWAFPPTAQLPRQQTTPEWTLSSSTWQQTSVAWVVTDLLPMGGRLWRIRPAFFPECFFELEGSLQLFLSKWECIFSIFFFIPGIQFLSMMRNEVKELAL